MSIQEQLSDSEWFVMLLEGLILLWGILLPVSVMILGIWLYIKNKRYKNSAYYSMTKLWYPSLVFDKGRYGEYLIYDCLKHLEAQGARFLVNLYIPKKNGETTEIDVLMICTKGIFVFESKNYSGWIFGNEGQKNWCQTLPIGRGRSRKEYFYNPIMQNRSHIKHLRAFLGDRFPIWSIIVFSDRCTLKNLRITSEDVIVVNRRNVPAVVSDICNRMSANLLDECTIEDLYSRLYPCTQVSAVTKDKHIADIANNLNASRNVVSVVAEPAIAQVQPQFQLQRFPSVSASPIPSNSADSIVSTEPLSPQPTVLIQEEPQSQKCPQCGGRLVVRVAKRGVNIGRSFYGCSNYPKCTYIQNINTEGTDL